MTDQTAQEPTMEEILASIRRIISEDDAPAESAAAPEPVAELAPEPVVEAAPLVEAQAMARCVIASDLGGPTETVEDGVTGWRVPPGDPQALAAAIGQVLAMAPEARAVAGARARAAVLAGYTTARMQAATLDVYRELL